MKPNRADAPLVHSLRAAVVQFPVGMEVARNLECLTACIAQLDTGTLAVAPKGALSGYAPAQGFVASLAQKTIAHAIDSARSTAANKKNPSRRPEATLALKDVSDWVLRQARDDVVAVCSRE